MCGNGIIQSPIVYLKLEITRGVPDSLQISALVSFRKMLWIQLFPDLKSAEALKTAANM